MPLARGRRRSCTGRTHLHRDSIGAAPSGAAPNLCPGAQRGGAVRAPSPPAVDAVALEAGTRPSASARTSDAESTGTKFHIALQLLGHILEVRLVVAGEEDPPTSHAPAATGSRGSRGSLASCLRKS